MESGCRSTSSTTILTALTLGPAVRPFSGIPASPFSLFSRVPVLSEKVPRIIFPTSMGWRHLIEPSPSSPAGRSWSNPSRSMDIAPAHSEDGPSRNTILIGRLRTALPRPCVPAFPWHRSFQNRFLSIPSKRQSATSFTTRMTTVAGLPTRRCERPAGWNGSIGQMSSGRSCVTTHTSNARGRVFRRSSNTGSDSRRTGRTRSSAPWPGPRSTCGMCSDPTDPSSDTGESVSPTLPGLRSLDYGHAEPIPMTRRLSARAVP